VGVTSQQQRNISFAASEPDLAQNSPVNLRELRALHVPFDHARSPEISSQINDLEKSEKQRREEGERGSDMVKKHHPYPELRPKHELEPKRATFEQAWLKEQRAAKLAQYQDEYVSNQQSQEKSQEILPFTPNMAR
jgi:hypothetical protein